VVEADALASKLWTRLGSVVGDLGLSFWGLTAMPRGDSLAQYDSVAGRVLYLVSLSERERVMTVLHELVHAYLHRPSPANTPDEKFDESEERLAHAVARRVCDALGIAGYSSAVAQRGVPDRLLTDVQADQHPTVDAIAAFLESCMTGCGRVTWPPEP
jgi:hypothetical protein